MNPQTAAPPAEVHRAACWLFPGSSLLCSWSHFSTNGAQRARRCTYLGIPGYSPDRQLPRRAIGLVGPFRDLGITDNDFFGRIPFEFLTRADGDVAEVTDCRRTMADGHVANRQLTALDTIEPVRVMLLAFVKPNVAGFEWFLENRVRQARMTPRLM